MIFNIICQLTLAAMCDVANGQGGDKLTDLYLIGLFPKNGSWQGGRGLQPAAEMAVEDINKRNDILPEFKLIMESRDTECSRGLGMKALADTIGGTKKTIMIIGGGCSTVSQAVAQTAHFWNLVQISYASVSPALSNRKRFPNFFRLVVSESVLNEARMALIEHYNWKRVAILYEDHQIFSKMAEDLVKGLKSKKLNIIKSSFFTDDPETALQELKEADARIIIGGFYPDKARRVFCTAYNIGFYGKQVWLTTGALSYDSRWWKERDPKINCTEFEMERVVQDVLVVHNIYTNTNDTEEGLTRLSVQKFKKIYTNKTSNMKQPLSGADRAAVGYDTVWAASIALNKTMNNLTETGRGKTLANFSYVDDEMANLIKANLRQVRFTSVSGRVAFKENGDGIRLVGIDLIRGGNVSLVGIYDKSKPEGEKLEIPHRIWKGNIPSDAMEVKKVPHVLSISTYACMTSIAGFGIILALIFLFFNIVNRNVK